MSNPDFDQVIVTGGVGSTITLSGSLKVDLLSGFNPSVGQTFDIINNQANNAIQGTFSGMPEGSVFAVGNTKFSITYKGGKGNDVVLTVVNPSAAVTATTAAPKTPDTGLAAYVAKPFGVLLSTTAAAFALVVIARRLRPVTTAKK